MLSTGVYIVAFQLWLQPGNVVEIPIFKAHPSDTEFRRLKGGIYNFHGQISRSCSWINSIS